MSTTAAFIRSLLTLRREKRSGVLAVKAEGGSVTYVYLEHGTPVFVEDTTSGETLGRLLRREGAITQAQYVEVLGRMTDAFVLNEQLRFGEVAVELGYLTEAQVSRALTEQMRRKMLVLLQRTETTWSFDESVARLDDVGRFPMVIEALVLEAMRWVDDEQKIDIALGAALDRSMRIDPVGNAERLRAARSGGRPAYVLPNRLDSELVLRVKGEGYPQMPAGGLNPEQLEEVEAWIEAGAPIPQ